MKAIFYQPLAQWRLAAVGLQDQARLAAVEDFADRLTARTADADRRDPVSRLNRRQAIGQAHGDPQVLTALAHGAFGRVKWRQCHLAGRGATAAAMAPRRSNATGR
jgi:hypothetical protein